MPSSNNSASPTTAGSAKTGPVLPHNSTLSKLNGSSESNPDPSPKPASGNTLPATTEPKAPQVANKTSLNAEPSNSHNSPSDLTPPAGSAQLLEDQKMKDILLSDVGVESLLSRMKQSVHSVREFAVYVKKMAQVETEYSVHLKKTSRSLTDTFKRPEIKKGTFQSQILGILRSTDKYGDAGNTFIDAIHKIHDELAELVRTMDRQRKTAKETALRHEKNLVDAERECEKAKNKYDSACEELEKARTADPNKSKLGFKNKSEEELHRRMTVCEVDYQQKVDTCQKMRRELVEKLRVQDVHRLQNLVLECDNALSLQVLRFANLFETLQLNRGFVISPIVGPGSNHVSVKGMAGKMDSELDFYNYVCGIAKKKSSLNRAPVVFKKHPTLGRQTGNVGAAAAGSGMHKTSTPTSQSQAPKINTSIPSSSFNSTPATGSSSYTVPAKSSFVGGGTAKTGPVLKPSGTLDPAKVGTGAAAGAAVGAGASSANTTATSSTAAPSGSPNAIQPTNSISSATTQSTQTTQATQTPSGGAAAGGAAAPEKPSETYDPSKHGLAVFGTPLEDLLDYEEGTVPRIVYQCVQAIDNFGLEVEGIYRTNGNSGQVAEIRREFDIDATAVDLLRPNNGVNDIHSVSSALKQYFLALPDPLLTKEFHREFINAASIKDDIRRRDSIHAVINKLPDPNYTTLRYLIFHLYRVQEREQLNKMSVNNLSIVWGPALMDTDYQNTSEMAIQSQVVETIVLNAYAIFEAE